jgi:hypothetical protein
MADEADARRVVVVLPEDAGAPAARALAEGADLARGPLGAIDNGLWRTTPVVLATIGELLAAEGGGPVRSTPFDHLAADFDDQRAALAPFAGEVVGAVAGLGA